MGTHTLLAPSAAQILIGGVFRDAGTLRVRKLSGNGRFAGWNKISLTFVVLPGIN